MIREREVSGGGKEGGKTKGMKQRKRKRKRNEACKRKEKTMLCRERSKFGREMGKRAKKRARGKGIKAKQSKASGEEKERELRREATLGRRKQARDETQRAKPKRKLY